MPMMTIQSHDLDSLERVPGTAFFKATCACGWTRTGENELVLAIRHQSHMLDAHEQNGIKAF